MVKMVTTVEVKTPVKVVLDWSKHNFRVFKLLDDSMERFGMFRTDAVIYDVDEVKNIDDQYVIIRYHGDLMCRKAVYLGDRFKFWTNNPEYQTVIELGQHDSVIGKVIGYVRRF